jgi:hypothetical protein
LSLLDTKSRKISLKCLNRNAGYFKDLLFQRILGAKPLALLREELDYSRGKERARRGNKRRAKKIVSHGKSLASAIGKEGSFYESCLYLPETLCTHVLSRPKHIEK